MARGTHVYSYDIEIPQIRADGGAEIQVYIERGGTPIGVGINEDGVPQIHVLVEPMGGREVMHEFAVFRYGRAPGVRTAVKSEDYLGAIVIIELGDVYHVFWTRETRRTRKREGPDTGESPRRRRRRQS